MSAPLLYLASTSPRRQTLLAQLGLEFETLRLREAAGRPRDVVEEAQDAEPPLHYVERIAGLPPERFGEMIEETPQTEALLKRFVGLVFA